MQEPTTGDDLYGPPDDHESTVKTIGAYRKSKQSGNGETLDCVEVAQTTDGRISVRDSKNPQGPVLLFTLVIWMLLIAITKLLGHRLNRRLWRIQRWLWFGGSDLEFNDREMIAFLGGVCNCEFDIANGELIDLV